ncbi:MAG: hypothetical protein EOR80_16415 [Mesorhizobium sp.]|uniref:hypothetical protein n=2 Tax=Mesorhizobium sp. TaxID=1871066 RepID=UPI000FE4DBFD|nr:hypothetical protein [Mesorhizobium sp.]RWH88881.1 MAG: hypothetical protein EOQ87_18965 [Mesorhizobium sp.]RWH96904.1 MAG: hypothetical protein EOQ88_17975 [Mesorhizobium sp.]RWI00034.1 MAG: hypothetical protein EOQ89_19865 [Mesorhizobium sp.]RWI17108.1 MAG: hypothetical protein EOQ91_18400 [Mesorhizobium sp.]RWM65653.1 MAG: hypothetical protein EOR80_16415 [Mesorhizobium sp.]
MLRDLSAYKKMLMLGIVGLVFVAAFDAISNLPVVSGCAFYGNCAIDRSAEAPIELGLDPTEP